MTKDLFDGWSRIEKNGMIGLFKTLRPSVSVITTVRKILPRCLGLCSP